MTKKEKEKREAVYALKCFGVRNNTTINAKVTHVSSSGMFRRVQLFIVKKGVMLDISYCAAKALQWGYKEAYNGGIAVSGCGMDMLFHTVDSLSYAMGYGSLAQGADDTKGLRYKAI